MAFELDHLFVWTSVGAPEGDQLVEFGLTEGAPNSHPGQGTACRRFFFRNAYLELLWVRDPAEAQGEVIRPLHLWERWSRRSADACPFGLIFRPGSPATDGAPFASVDYHPPYLPDALNIQVATNAGVIDEPSLFHLPFARRPDRYPANNPQCREHTAGLREVTRVELASPSSKCSPALKSALKTGVVGMRAGSTFLIDLGFDGEQCGKSADFRPALPLRFQW